MYRSHAEATTFVRATPEQLFAFLDDPERLSAHMNRRSWMTAGARMEVRLDAGRGLVVGSHITLAGRVVGVRLSLDEVVVARNPPRDKTWQTVGEPRLLVIGRYRMGFEVRQERGAEVRVWIDYDPPNGLGRLLGFFFGPVYASWCVHRMIRDARRAFGASEKKSLRRSGIA